MSKMLEEEYIKRILLPEAERKATVTVGIYIDKLEELIAFLIKLDYKTRKEYKIIYKFCVSEPIKRIAKFFDAEAIESSMLPKDVIFVVFKPKDFFRKENKDE